MAAYEPIESPDESTVFPYHDLTPPTTADLFQARETVRRHLPETPLVRSETLSSELDAEVYLIRIAVVHYWIDRSTACGRPGK